jgi:hypothetical protein
MMGMSRFEPWSTHPTGPEIQTDPLPGRDWQPVCMNAGGQLRCPRETIDT